MKRQVIITLLQKHFSATATEVETAALMEWLPYVGGPEFDEVIESFPNQYRELKAINPAFAQRLEQRIDAIDRQQKKN